MLTRKQKENIVGDIQTSLKEKGSLLLLDYKGVDAGHMVELRQRVRDAGGRLRVVKKTLLKRAIAGAELPELADEAFEGQTGVVYDFADPVAAAKAVANFRKELVDEKGDDIAFAIRGGMLRGEALGTADASALATIPTREELLAKAVGSIASPLRGLVGVLSGPQRQFVYALNAVRESKA